MSEWVSGGPVNEVQCPPCPLGCAPVGRQWLGTGWVPWRGGGGFPYSNASLTQPQFHGLWPEYGEPDRGQRTGGDLPQQDKLSCGVI